MTTLQASSNDSPRRSGNARSNFINSNHASNNSVDDKNTTEASESHGIDVDVPVDLNIFVTDLLEQMVRNCAVSVLHS